MPKYFPYEDFIIYEIGAGNGTLAMNILDYLQEAYPAVYDRTRYVIIEISAKMAESQKERLTAAHSCVQVVNESIFRWKVREPAPCFFLAMEVVVSHCCSVSVSQLSDIMYHRTTSVTTRCGMTFEH